MRFPDEEGGLRFGGMVRWGRTEIAVPHRPGERDWRGKKGDGRCRTWVEVWERMDGGFYVLGGAVGDGSDLIEKIHDANAA